MGWLRLVVLPILLVSVVACGSGIASGRFSGNGFTITPPDGWEHHSNESQDRWLEPSGNGMLIVTQSHDYTGTLTEYAASEVVSLQQLMGNPEYEVVQAPQGVAVRITNTLPDGSTSLMLVFVQDGVAWKLGFIGMSPAQAADILVTFGFAGG